MADDDLRPQGAMEPEDDDLDARAQWGGAAPAGNPAGACGITRVRLQPPGMPPLDPTGGRAPRRASATAALDAGARDNWRPTGPRNVGGRVRALASAGGAILYAGTASGGVWKTTDDGESWFPCWRDDAPPAIGALAVAPTRAERIYAATGEIRPAGLNMRGSGVWTSDDSGATWSNVFGAAPVASNPAHVRGFDAVAVDPNAAAHCWAVGGDGAFRTVDGGRTWQRFLDRVHVSDVAFSDGDLWLARGASLAGEAALVRLRAPLSGIGAAEGDVRTALAAAGNVSTVAAAPADDRPWPARIKIAFGTDNTAIAYARVIDEDDRHVGVFRTGRARAANATAVTWVRLPDHPDWFDENFGTYTLCIAVDPADANRVVTGMINLYVSTNGAAASASSVEWRRAMWSGLFDEVRAHHADNHDLVFVGVADRALWVANDGGISRSENWATGGENPGNPPPPPGVIAWHKRDAGLTCAQPYDLNQSPLVPTLYAIGMQDNGVFLTAGGPTWRRVAGGDGGFVSFDPDDPFRFMTTSQNGIEATGFPSHLDRFVTGEQPDVPPVSDRDLTDGFSKLDDPAFVADTEAQRLERGRVLHTRRRRVYGMRRARGERWQPEKVGRSFEIVATSGNETVRIEVLPSDGATHLGLFPTVVERRFPRDPLTEERVDRGPRAVAAVASRLPAPWKLTAGDELRLRVDGADVTVTFAAGDFPDIAKVTLAQLLAKVQPALPVGCQILPLLWPAARAVEIVTRGRGPNERIRLGGTAVAPVPADGLSRLGLNAGTYSGDDDRPASVTLGFEGVEHEEQVLGRDLTGLTLTIKVNDEPERAVPIDATSFSDVSKVTAGELAAALAKALEPDPVDVFATNQFKAVCLRAESGHSVVVAGTAAARLDAPPAGAEEIVFASGARWTRHRRSNVRNHNGFDLTSPGPSGLKLEIRDGVSTTGEIEITAADVADRRSVTVEELHRIVRRALATVPAIRVRAELVIAPHEDQAQEIEMPPGRPREAWVGGGDGSVFVTDDDGDTWRDVTPPEARLADARVEAIALHPTSDQIAYVGLWRLTAGPRGRGMLFRTETRGASWTQVGSNEVGGALTGVVGNGRPLGIRALEIDPGDPRTVFAATDAGVFRTRDEGATWEPFSEGLPHTSMVDLALADETRVLRAAAWGRATWERRVGAEPPDDVRLVVRASELDDGSRERATGPDLYAAAPSAEPPGSPDVKVVRRRPGSAGPNVDGVEFDAEFPDDEIVDMPAGLAGPDHASEIVVQVHNRGSFPTRSLAVRPALPAPDVVVRVVVLWAPLPGPTPPPLPGDFWTRFAAATLGATEGAWTVVVDHRLPGDLRPGTPAVVGAGVTWPRDLGVARVGVLVLVTGSDDALEDGPTDVTELVASERRAAFKSVPVARAADDRTLVLRSTGPRAFEVRAPTEGNSAAPALQIAPADLVVTRRRLRAGTLAGASYALPAAEPALLVMEEPVIVDVELRAGDFADATAATPAEVAEFINARLRAAGAAAFARTAEVGVRLRALGGARVRAVSGAAAAALRWPTGPGPGVPQLDTRARDGAIDLTGNKSVRLEVRAQSNHTFDVTFPAQAFYGASDADPERVAGVLNRAIAAARLEGLLRCDVLRGIVVDGRRDAEVTVAGPVGFPLGGGPAGRVQDDTGTIDVSASPIVRVTVQNRVTVRFDRDPDLIPDVADASPQDVRRALNAELEGAGMSVRAERARSELVVRDSSTSAGAPVTIGGTGLADVATSGDAPAVDPASLFGARAALSADRLKAGVVNHVYVRVANVGNVDALPARVRLVRVDASPEPPAPPGLSEVVFVSLDVNAERDAVAHLEITPAAGPDEFEHVLAIVDENVEGRRVGTPAPADLETLVALCETRAELALRTFEVVT